MYFSVGSATADFHAVQALVISVAPAANPVLARVWRLVNKVIHKGVHSLRGQLGCPDRRFLAV